MGEKKLDRTMIVNLAYVKATIAQFSPKDRMELIKSLIDIATDRELKEIAEHADSQERMLHCHQ